MISSDEEHLFAFAKVRALKTGGFVPAGELTSVLLDTDIADVISEQINVITRMD